MGSLISFPYYVVLLQSGAESATLVGVATYEVFYPLDSGSYAELKGLANEGNELWLWIGVTKSLSVCAYLLPRSNRSTGYFISSEAYSGMYLTCGLTSNFTEVLRSPLLPCC